MGSMPGDDLSRGRRLVRRRRWGAVGTAAVLVPALAVGAAAASNGLFTGSSAAGHDTVVPEGSTTDAPSDDASCGSVGSATPGIAPPGTEPNSLSLSAPNHAKGNAVETGKAESTVRGIAPSNGAASSADGSSTIGPEDPDGSVGCVTDTGGGLDTAVCAAGDKECYTFPDDAQQTATMDRLTQLLGGLDPTGAHTGGASSGGVSSGSASAGGGTGGDQGTQSLMVGMSWDEGDHEGAVALSVFSTADPDLVGTGCSDQTMGGGPDVTCEQKTLADGTVIEVGHGQKGGAERLTVAYERADGQVVIATADQASTSWWDSADGAAPLDTLPATIEQLTALVTAPGAHL
jgi:hypothetical protein